MAIDHGDTEITRRARRNLVSLRVSVVDLEAQRRAGMTLLRNLQFNAAGDEMAINWIRNADEALAAAKQAGKPLLMDFTAAPM